MAHYKIVPVEFGHMIELAGNMRGADIDEVWASHRLTPAEAVFNAVTTSKGAKTQVGLADGEVICMFGVHRQSELTSIGSPWLLNAANLPLHTREFARASRHEYELMLEEYDLLFNYADARNTLALRWLKWLGFEIMEAEPFGWLGLPFHRFQMEKEKHV